MQLELQPARRSQAELPQVAAQLAVPQSAARSTLTERLALLLLFEAAPQPSEQPVAEQYLPVPFEEWLSVALSVESASLSAQREQLEEHSSASVPLRLKELPQAERPESLAE